MNKGSFFKIKESGGLEKVKERVVFTEMDQNYLNTINEYIDGENAFALLPDGAVLSGEIDLTKCERVSEFLKQRLTRIAGDLICKKEFLVDNTNTLVMGNVVLVEPVSLLFAYGTLKKDEMLRALLGRVPNKRPAKLIGYEKFVDGGYIFLKKSAGSKVETAGEILELTADEIEVTDAWEEVPLYVLKDEIVHSERGVEQIRFYTRDVDGERFSGDGASAFSGEAVIRDLALFRKELLSKK